MNFHEMTIIYRILKHVKYDAVVMAMYECLLHNHYCGNKTINCWRNRFSVISVIQPMRESLLENSLIATGKLII